MNNIRKVWVKKGKAWECQAYRPPYRPEDVVEDGLPFEEWVNTPTLETDQFHDPPASSDADNAPIV